MRILLTLLRKEWLEAWRDKKLIWLPIVFILLAVSQPLSLYFMDDMLKIAGNLPEGAVIEFPTPRGEEVLAGTLSQFDFVGTAIIVLSVMGIISQERNNGALALIMSRPITPWQYIVSKWLAHTIILILAFIISYSVAYYYTALLFNEVEVAHVLISSLIYLLWICFIVVVTLVFGTFMKKTGGIAGASLITLAVLLALNSLLPKFFTWSPMNAPFVASEYVLTGQVQSSVVILVGTTGVIIASFLVIAILRFKYLDNYAP